VVERECCEVDIERDPVAYHVVAVLERPDEDGCQRHQHDDRDQHQERGVQADEQSARQRILLPRATHRLSSFLNVPVRVRWVMLIVMMSTRRTTPTAEAKPRSFSWIPLRYR